MTCEFLTSLVILNLITSTNQNQHIGSFSQKVENKETLFDKISNFFLPNSNFTVTPKVMINPHEVTEVIPQLTLSRLPVFIFDDEIGASIDDIEMTKNGIYIDSEFLDLPKEVNPIHVILADRKLLIKRDAYDMLRLQVPKFYPAYTDRVYRNLGHRCRNDTLPTETEYNQHIDECIHKDEEDAAYRQSLENYDADDYNMDNYLNHHEIEDQGWAEDPDNFVETFGDDDSTAYDNDYGGFEGCDQCDYDQWADRWYPCDFCACYCYDEDGIPYEQKCLNCTRYDEERADRHAFRKNSGRYEPKIKIISNSDDSKKEITSSGDHTDLHSSDEPDFHFDENGDISMSDSKSPSPPPPITIVSVTTSNDDSSHPKSVETSETTISVNSQSNPKLTQSLIDKFDSYGNYINDTLSSSDVSDNTLPLDKTQVRPHNYYKETYFKQKKRGNPNIKTSHHSTKKPNNKRPNSSSTSSSTQSNPQKKSKKNLQDHIHHSGTEEGRKAFIARNEKKAEKLKKGLVFKNGRKSGVGKEAKLINNAYREEADRKFAEISANIETAEIELDNLMMPNIQSEFYKNASKERDYYETKMKEFSAEKKKKQYAANEVKVNKTLNTIMNDWQSTELSGIVKFATTLEDLEKVETFLKDNVSDAETVNSVVNAVAKQIEKEPDLMDKVSNFLKGAILKLKPLAFSLDTVRDIPLGVDILKDDSEVIIGPSIKIGEILDSLGNIKVDMRDDNARRGELIHEDPLLRQFVIRRTLRDGILSTRTDHAGTFSAELLFQLMSPSVCNLNASEEVVMSKMCHIANTIHTINLPKWSFIQNNTFIVDDTLYVARALYQTRRRIANALGFCTAPQ